MNLRFWEWFKKKQTTSPELDPSDLAVLEEYQKAVGVGRGSMNKIDRHHVGEGVVFSDPTEAPDLGKDDAETLKRKLKHGIHQSTEICGADTLKLDGVRAIGESITVVGKVDKSKLYDLGYDIKEESASMVRSLGLEPEIQAFPGARQPVVNPDATEEEILQMEGVHTYRYSGKPENRPWELRPNPITSDEEERAAQQYMAPFVLVSPNIDEETKARIEAFHALAANHDPSCEWYTHFMEHITDRGEEFECLYDACKCKGKNNGDDQGNLAPV